MPHLEQRLDLLFRLWLPRFTSLHTNMKSGREEVEHTHGGFSHFHKDALGQAGEEEKKAASECAGRSGQRAQDINKRWQISARK